MQTCDLSTPVKFPDRTVSIYYVIMDVVVWSWVVSCVHCVKVPVRTFTQCTELTTQLNTTSAEHHMQ